MATPLVIVGAGGFGRETHDIVEAINQSSLNPLERIDFLGFIDNHVALPELLASRGPLLGGDEILERLPAGTRYVIAIGSGSARRELDKRATALGLEPATLIHPAATMGNHNVIIGPGSIICSHVSLTTDIRIGRHVHLNLNVTVGHDAALHDYVTVNPGATISGAVTLEHEVTVGTGAAIIQGLSVGARSMIGGAGRSIGKRAVDVTG